MSVTQGTEIRCGQCNRLVGVLRPDGSLELVVRHGKEKHMTIVRGMGTQ
ncbi:MAG: hypothetical protein IIC24_10880 [Chloroflexi bacterium]|nr:hypothetical protein [Chloroflexota bacterium]